MKHKHKLTNVKVRKFALTRKGTNKVNTSIMKSGGGGDIFSNLSEEDQQILEKSKGGSRKRKKLNKNSSKETGDLAKAELLLEVDGVIDQLRTEEIDTAEAADSLEEILIKHEKDIPLEKNESEEEEETDENLVDFKSSDFL